MALFSNAWITYSYDRLSRLSLRTVGDILTEHQTYLAGSGTCTTTTLPETFYTTAKGSSSKLSGFRYAYNEVGNVTQITNLVNGTYQKFAYDKLGQMQYVTDYGKDGTAYQRYKYYYDNAGNLTSWVIQDGTGTITGVEHTYTYGDANCKDLLTAFDGQSITYDGGGNPLSYYNGKRYTMAWRNGRELDCVTVDGKTYRCEYDVNVLRTRKTNADGGYTLYYIVDGLTVAERRFTSAGAIKYTLWYSFDENNSPVGFSIQYPGKAGWTNYYFAKNLQGDVIALYEWHGINNSTLIATYRYDPWGNPTGIYRANGTGISQTADDVATYNPFRYRGYRYDAETGFYYLQSRYYDPAICRFINADSQLNAKDGILGYNLFTYCDDNPIMFSDPSGHSILLACIIVSAVIGGLAGGHVAAKASKAQTGKVNGWAVAGGIVAGGALGGLTGWGIGASITAIGATVTGAAGTAAAPIVEQVAEKASTALQTYYPPNNGFSGAIEKISLDVGTIIQRTGDFAGRFTAPAGTPSQMLSLPYDKIGQATTYLQTTQPIQALSGTVAPWFGQIGGGTQYLLLDGRVDQLLAEGILKIFGE